MIDGRHASRFRDPWTPDKLPRVVGLCMKCHREMWTNLPSVGGRAGRVHVSADLRHCEPCLRYIRTTGKDPEEKMGSAAERIPAERAETDQWWRAPSLARCAGTASDAFAPDPMPDEAGDVTDAEREEILEQRRYAAEFLCGPCRVSPECRKAARVHGYEGLWGGRFFARIVWHDPLSPNVKGPTIYTLEPRRTKMIAKLAEMGLDADGEVPTT